MTNKSFEAVELNHRYIKFYQQAVLDSHSAFLARGHSSTDARQSAITQAQQLVRLMGYINPTEE